MLHDQAPLVSEYCPPSFRGRLVLSIVTAAVAAVFTLALVSFAYAQMTDAQKNNLLFTKERLSVFSQMLPALIADVYDKGAKALAARRDSTLPVSQDRVENRIVGAWEDAVAQLELKASVVLGESVTLVMPTPDISTMAAIMNAPVDDEAKVKIDTRRVHYRVIRASLKYTENALVALQKRVVDATTKANMEITNAK